MLYLHLLYGGMILAVARTGDVRSFNELLSKWEKVFINKGTYLLMEKCLMLVYRNLVKKMSVSPSVTFRGRWGLILPIFDVPIAEKMPPPPQPQPRRGSMQISYCCAHSSLLLYCLSVK